MQHKHVIIACGLAGILALGGLGAKYAGEKAITVVHKLVAEQTVLQGKLEFKNVKANLTGDVVFEDVVWKDPQGKKIAVIPSLNVYVKLLDALKGEFGVKSIDDIMLENPEFNVEYIDKNGLNIINLINFPKQKEDKPTDFRGALEIRDAKVHLVMNGEKLEFTKVKMQANLKQYPTMKFNLQGRNGEADLIGDIVKNNDNVDIKAEVKKLPITEIMKLLPSFGQLKIASGVIPTSKLIATLKDNAWKVDLTGNVTNVAGNAVGYNFAEGSGSYAINNSGVTFSAVQSKVEGQAVTMDGQINFKEKNIMPEYNLNVATPSFRIDAISPGLGIADAFTAKAKVAGPIDNPTITGEFSLPQLSVAPLYMTDITGKYVYNSGLIKLTEAQGNVYSGTVAVDGTINAADKAFELNIAGSGLDSTAVTETQIEGPLDFDLITVGTGNVDSAVANGTFVIGEGNYAGIPFEKITGGINKTPTDMVFSDIVVFAGGVRLVTTANINSNGKVTFGKLDAASALSLPTKEEIREDINSKVEEAATKGLKKLFGK